MDCPHCDTANPEKARFCVRCGIPLPPSCARCGSSNTAEARFCAWCGAKLDAAPVADDMEHVAETSIPPEAERRQLTLMFIDLVDSTALSTLLDPEDLRMVIGSYQNGCTEVIQRWGGHVARYLGDGVLAYFGWPQAHEDDAERAVRAGLEVADVVGRLRAPKDEPVAARVGIATGLVVVGDLIGAGAAREDVVGETPNLAARLQALAQPGMVVIATATRRLLGGLFELADLGAHDLKGFSEPVSVWQVVGTGIAESRFEALHGQYLIPIVGREEELNLLLARWRRAADGEGQVVLLSGEPGIGKSRIVQALRERLTGECYTPLSHYCSPFHTASALYPIVGLFERAAGFNQADQPETKLDKLETLLARSTEGLAEAVPLIAQMMGIETGRRYPPSDLSPQRKALRTLDVLVEQIERLAAHQPVLAVYEDVHWIDPTTLEALSLLIQRAQRLPVLVLITFRPEFTPPWIRHAHVTQLSLSRLTRRHGSAIVTELTGGKTLPEEVLDEIIARTDGIPLFLEELTKAVLETGLLQKVKDHYELVKPLPRLAIPSTLQDSLMARLDHLAPVKEIAQIGSVIGRDFGHQLLAAVSTASERRLCAALDRLVASELILRQGSPPDATYIFKHVLIQEAAYNSLLKSRRQQLHGRIAQALKEQFPAVAASRPELIAYHLTGAALTEEAVSSWHAAGRQAAERFAHKEASAHFAHGMQLLRTLPDKQRGTELETELQIAFGVSLMATKGPTAEVADVYARARDLAEQLGDARHLYAAVWGLWFYHTMRMEFDAARSLSYELIELAESAEDQDLLLQAHHSAWAILLYRGELQACREHTELGLALYDSDRHRTHALTYGGHDPGVCARYQGAMALWLLGYPDRALGLAKEAITLARTLGQPFSEVIALNSACCIHQFRGEEASTGDLAEAALALAETEGFRQYLLASRALRGWATSSSGQVEAGLEEIGEALVGLRAAGVGLRLSFYLALLADASAKAGKLDEGLSAADEGLKFVKESGERWWEADLYRLKGELLLAKSTKNDGETEIWFQRALETARRQNAKAFELRTATSLARLWVEQGKRPQAHELLAPVYSWFTEGFDTTDLKKARTLLDEIG